MDDPEGTIPEGSVFFWRNRFGGTVLAHPVSVHRGRFNKKNSLVNTFL